jgi:hypothetical protein
MSLLNFLKIDEKDLRWWHLSACRDMEVNNFFDDYEADDVLALNIDQLCINCPVARQCFQEGLTMKETGVRGGVYLKSGKVDQTNNSHKTQETWEILGGIHGRQFP